MAKSVTLKNISDRLNISPSLVSRALADKYGVSEEMRILIKKTAEDMRYVPRLSKAAARQRQKTLIFVDSGILNPLSAQANVTGCYSQALNGVTQSLEQLGVGAELLVTQYYLPTEIHQMVVQRNPYGIVLLGHVEERFFSAVSTCGVPLVMIDPYVYRGKEFDTVMADNYAIGYQAAGYMADHGHKHIAFVGNRRFSISFRDRFHGFCARLEELEDQSIQWRQMGDAQRDCACDFTQVRELLADKKRPTAFVCTNDPILQEIYKTAVSLGLSIPQDISLIGCDNIDICLPMQQATFDLNFLEMGQVAAHLLHNRISNPDYPSLYIQIAPRFVEGKTAASI